MVRLHPPETDRRGLRGTQKVRASSTHLRFWCQGLCQDENFISRSIISISLVISLFFTRYCITAWE